ncbi:hypothetical protein LCGC14_2408080 [marine sediment metagenome]|uniref:Right handed beta helix domain-containing protein n=1 Tax=marine sediment metagenome TaxID=412755 RepID=A0A0F9CFC0_9ZZZZ
MATFGDKIYEFGGVPIGGQFSTEPNSTFFLKASGSDGKDGKKPSNAVLTLARAHLVMPADKNAVVYLVSESNSAGSTTIRIEGATQTWSKDGTHIVGVSSGGMFGSRARISGTADTADVSPLMEWSADNGSMKNIHLFYGENDAGDLGAFQVSGERNYFYNCHFAGIGNATQDATDAYSLSLTGDENMFERCVIGLDTVGRGTASNSEIQLVTGQTATRNIFKDCIILTNADAAGHQFIKSTGDLSLDRFLMFDNCNFINSGVNAGGATMTEAFDLSTTMGGTIILKDCSLFGCTEWDAGDGGDIQIVGASGIATTSGIGLEPAV